MKAATMEYFLSGLLAKFSIMLWEIAKAIGLKTAAQTIFKPILKFFPENIVVYRQDYDALEKKIVEKVILALPSLGCEHYFKSGGCAMCGFNNEIKKYGLNRLHPSAIEFFTYLFLGAFENAEKRRAKRADCLAIFMGGSFFNSRELPLRAQEILLAHFRQSKIKKLVIESRPEYIAAGIAKMDAWNFTEIGKQVEIVIGLEAMDDDLRNNRIKKHISRQDYQEAVLAIKTAGFISSTYALIGAPHLSERQIIESAVETAKFAWRAGTDVVNLETYSVQAQTPWANFYRQGWIKPPSLWAVAEVIRRVDSISPQWYLGEFSDWPEPIAKPGSCPVCERKLLDVFGELRENHDARVLYNLPFCTCAGLAAPIAA